MTPSSLLQVVHLNNKPFACSLCDYRAGQKASLIAHNHSVHEKSKPYVCEHCGYKTTSQSTLNAHNRASIRAFGSRAMACFYNSAKYWL
jgi:KRAB domain-containing zinc finger protein